MKTLLLILFLDGCADQPYKSFQQKVERITALRERGGTRFGMEIVGQNVQVDDDDFLLIGCENACAMADHPGLDDEERSENQWMAASADLSRENAGYNYHSSLIAGKEVIEIFLADRTKPQYLCSPQEVAWHYLRRLELISQNVPEGERIEIMTRERKEKPWEHMQ